MSKHLTYHELRKQFGDCRLRLTRMYDYDAMPSEVRIRTETGDHYLAAIHREGDTLIFDLGVPCEP